MVISSEQACQRGWKEEIVQRCPKIQALCLESTVCCWVPEVQFQSFVTVTTATTSSSSTLHWLSNPFRGGVNESRFTSSPALSCVKSLINALMLWNLVLLKEAVQWLDLGDP